MFLPEILGIQAHQIVLVYRVHPKEEKKKKRTYENSKYSK